MQKDPIQDAHPSSAGPILIHLGAGRCSELATYLAMQPGYLLLVEADPRLVTLLRERVGQVANVEVRCTAVAAQSGTATFYRYNLADAGSLHPATGLRNLYPGLRVVEEATITADSAVELFEALQLDQAGRHLLIVDIPGEEFAVLQSLEAAGLLAKFSHLHLYCGIEPLYEGSVTAQTMVAWLDEHGFDLERQDAEQDPDRPCWFLRRNQLKLQMLELKLELENTQTARNEQVKLAEDLRMQLEAAAKEKAALAAARNEQVKLSQDLKQQLEQISAARDEQAKLAADLQAQLEQLAKVKDEQSKLAEERRMQLEAVVKEKAALAAVRDEQVKLSQELKQQLEVLTTGHEELLANRDFHLQESTRRQQQIEQLTASLEQQSTLTEELRQQLEQANVARDEQAKLTADRQAELEKVKAALQDTDNRKNQLEAQLAELQHRQQLMSEEMVKAEGQIELIKDLLLREPCL